MLVGDEYGGCVDDESDADVGAYGLYVCSRSPLPFFPVQRPTTTFDSQVFYTCRSSLPMFWGSSNKLSFVTDRTTQLLFPCGRTAAVIPSWKNSTYSTHSMIQPG